MRTFLLITAIVLSGCTKERQCPTLETMEHNRTIFEDINMSYEVYNEDV